MNNKKRKTLKSLLYSVPIAAALSFLPMKEAKGQMKDSNFFSNIWETNEQIKIKKPNALYFGVQLGRLPIQGYTVGYSRKVTPKLEPYILLSKGKYVSPPGPYHIDDFKDSHVDYTNISLGIMINLEKDHTGSNAFFCFGPSYNFLNKKDYISGTIDKKGLRELSVEGGVGVIFEGKGGIGFLFNSNVESKVFGKVLF